MTRFTTTLVSTLALAAGLAAASAPALAEEIKAGALRIETPWSRATPGGAKVAGGFMSITNTGSEPDRLIGGAMPRAGRFEVHEMKTENGIMTMRPLADGLVIPPGATVTLKPGSYHVMFMDLKEPLKDGETIEGELRFEKAGTVTVRYAVQPIGATTPGGGGASGKEMGGKESGSKSGGGHHGH
ncbi:copper chaperone PCu(A)C [Rhodoplanes serenus]|uniref:Copper chaperone PCu(A)C n=1 Tax=Rhodoplanes serenus TaxID=200615 RepID=A0A327KEF7_9BRAD|nr:copper chaperone PCu(A)C [Rhodoplanes serenus]MTW17371.1 copper chaperone PCu(A)C [Rhodoplanes serenus]RAI36521.1 hypothetical protein CH340_02770 [Rhodoplanes serenus]